MKFLAKKYDFSTEIKTNVYLKYWLKYFEATQISHGFFIPCDKMNFVRLNCKIKRRSAFVAQAQKLSVLKIKNIRKLFK